MKLNCRRSRSRSSRTRPAFFRGLLGDENVSDDVYARLRVSYGKTMFDALRLRERTRWSTFLTSFCTRATATMSRRSCATATNRRFHSIRSAPGSSVTRGTECFKAGVSIHLGTHMKRILSLNVVNQTVTVEPGILGPDSRGGAQSSARTVQRAPCLHLRPFPSVVRVLLRWVVGSSRVELDRTLPITGKAEDLVLSQEYITPVGTDQNGGCPGIRNRAQHRSDHDRKRREPTASWWPSP